MNQYHGPVSLNFSYIMTKSKKILQVVFTKFSQKNSKNYSSISKTRQKVSRTLSPESIVSNGSLRKRWRKHNGITR